MKRLITRQTLILDYLSSCDEILEEEPDNVKILRLRGLLYNVATEYDKALRDFEQVLRLLPTDVETYFLKSDCHYHKGEFDLAKRDYMRALRNQHNTTITEADINRAVVIDEQDLKDIHTVIEAEKNEAFERFKKFISTPDSE